MMPPPTVSGFTAEDFRRRALIERAPPEDGFYGDHRLNPGTNDLILKSRLRDAAVLIAVVDHPEAATVILTKRTETLRRHSGQVAFPGGAIDPEDASPEAAALRETEEEIGLPRADIEVLGRLPDYATGSGYRIAPVLGIVRPGFHLDLNPVEVEVAFEVPLAFLMDPANHARGSLMWQDRERFFYEMPYDGQHIWGVTAGIIRALYERLYL